MCQMYPDMPDSKYHRGDSEYGIASVNRQQKECHNRQRCAGNWYPQHAPVLVPHGPRTPEVSYPVDLIQHHREERNYQPQGPPGPRAQVEVRKYQDYACNRNLAYALHGQEIPVLVDCESIITFGLRPPPQYVGDEQHDQIDQADIREPEFHAPPNAFTKY